MTPLPVCKTAKDVNTADVCNVVRITVKIAFLYSLVSKSKRKGKKEYVFRKALLVAFNLESNELYFFY